MENRKLYNLDKVGTDCGQCGYTEDYQPIAITKSTGVLHEVGSTGNPYDYDILVFERAEPVDPCSECGAARRYVSVRASSVEYGYLPPE